MGLNSLWISPKAQAPFIIKVAAKVRRTFSSNILAEKVRRTLDHIDVEADGFSKVLVAWFSRK
jgi:hypothetical protein